MKAAENKDTPQPVILFDGVCNLCNGLVQFIIKRDKQGKFRLGSLQQKEGQWLLRQYDLPIDDYNSFVYIKENRVFLRSTGALHVLKDLGGLWQLLFAFIIVPRPVRDAIYSFIAKHRYSFFGKRDECMLPTADVKERFL